MMGRIWLLIPIFSSIILSFYCTTIKCDETVTPDVLSHIRYVPCRDRDGDCTLKSFMIKYTNSSEFIRTWILALYFDHAKYSSSDIVSEVLPSLSKKLLSHRIIFGRIRCNDFDDQQHKTISSMCNKMDPSTIYAYLNGTRTEFWWSVSDLLSHRHFVLGNLLTLQYKWQLDMFTEENHEEGLIQHWKEKEPERKYMMIVHVASANLEVNTTDFPHTLLRTSNLYRVRTFDLLGHMLQLIPDVRVAVVTGVIDDGVEFRYYDNVRCPKIHEDECHTFKITLEDLEHREVDDVLCDLERYSNGLQEYSYGLMLRPNPTTPGAVSGVQRLVRFCTHIFMADDEGTENNETYKKVFRDLEYQVYDVNMIVLRAPKDYARQLLTQVGATESILKHKIIFKFHTDQFTNDSTALLSNVSSPTGYSIVLKPYSGKLDSHVMLTTVRKEMKKFYIPEMSEDEDPEFNPYIDGDELFLLWSNQKAYNSPYLLNLNDTRFKQLISDSSARAVVLFYQPWSTGSVYSRDLVFPGAANYLKAEFGVGDRLYSVNCFDYNELCEKEKVHSYPHVKLYQGERSWTLPGTISLRGIVKQGFLLGQNYFTTKSAEDLKIILNYTNSVVDQAIIAVDVKDTKTIENLQKTADYFRGRELFVVSQHKHLPDHLKKRIAKGSVVSYSSRQQPDLVYRRGVNRGVSLSDFVANARRSRVNELTLDFFSEIAPSRRPLLMLFVHRMTSDLYCLLTGVAVERMGQMFATWMHARKQHEYIIFKDFQSPELILRDPNKGAFYRYKINATTFTPPQNCSKIDPSLDKWLSGVMNNEIQAHDVIQTREYVPSGPHIDHRDAMYPPEKKSDVSDKATDVSDKATDVSEPPEWTGTETTRQVPVEGGGHDSENVHDHTIATDEKAINPTPHQIVPDDISTAKLGPQRHDTEEL